MNKEHISDEEIEAARKAFLETAASLYPNAEVPIWLFASKAPFLKAIQAARRVASAL